jgi:hypothetical protein
MRHSRLFASLIVLAYVAPSHALRFSVQPGPPFVYIEVGSNTQTIDTVTFTVPAGPGAGTGTPVVGAPVIPITVLGYSGGNQSNYRITMNSAAGLTNSTGARIPFSEFSWTTRDGDIPTGQFNDSANQLLLQHNGRGNRARGITDYLTFSFANTAIYPSGVYTGLIVYTVTEL